MARARIVFAFVVICILSEFVAACGGGGGGSTSPPPPPPPPATVPGAPTIGTPTTGNAQISVAFTAPANNGGAAIMRYTATCSSASSGSGSGTAHGASSPIVVTNLTNNDPYTCAVTATNSVGTGPASAASATVTPTTPTPTLTSASSNLNWLAGSRELIQFALYGTNFTADSMVNYDSPYALQAISLFANSTTILVQVDIDLCL
jgi:hypothetical protein